MPTCRFPATKCTKTRQIGVIRPGCTNRDELSRPGKASPCPIAARSRRPHGAPGPVHSAGGLLPTRAHRLAAPASCLEAARKHPNASKSPTAPQQRSPCPKPSKPLPGPIGPSLGASTPSPPPTSRKHTMPYTPDLSDLEERILELENLAGALRSMDPRCESESSSIVDQFERHISRLRRSFEDVTTPRPALTEAA